MKNLRLILLLLSVSLFSQENREIEYIQKYALLAVEEMELYKIPASITLAQGILETGGGQSRLAEQANNHFGIKCKKEWTGESITHDDDALGECFRKYPSVKNSYRDHSKFLAERPYYTKLFKLKPTDYKGWAHGLKKAGYATNPRYAYILISKIEKYNLQKFDKISKDDVYDQVVALYGPVDRKVVDPMYEEETNIAAVPTIPKVETVVETPKIEKAEIAEVKANKPRKEEPKTKTITLPTRKISPRARVKRHPIGREYIVVLPGETLNKIANIYNKDVNKLMDYNELSDPKQLRAGQYLFFYKKKNKGAKKYYKVKKGDNMYLISQKAGIKLNQLYRRNRVEEGYQPKIGETLYLRGKKPRR